MVSALDFQAGYCGYKVDRAALGDRQRHQVCMGDP